MIEITNIELSEILTNNKLDNEKLLEEVNRRLKNISKNIDTLKTRNSNLRDALLALDKTLNNKINKDLKKLKTGISAEIKKVIEENFDNEEE